MKEAKKLHSAVSRLYFKKLNSNLEEWLEDQKLMFCYTDEIDSKYEEVDIEKLHKSMRSLKNVMVSNEKSLDNEE